MLMKAIRLTVPRFDLDELSKFLYSTGEVAVINKIAINYFRCGQQQKAFDIYGQLLKLVLKRTPNHKYLLLIAYNYARHLVLEDRLEEALEISEIGRKTCIKQEHYYLLPKFLHVEAECLYFTGRADKSKGFYRSAYYLYGAVGNRIDQELLRIAAEKRLNLVF